MHFYPDLKCSHSNLTGNGVSPERGAMFPRLDCQHDLIIAQHCRYLSQRQKHVKPKVKIVNTSGVLQHICVMSLLTTKTLYWVSSSRESFAKQHYIWADFLVVHSQSAACPRQSRLHLIGNPENLDETKCLNSYIPRPFLQSVGLQFIDNRHCCHHSLCIYKMLPERLPSSLSLVDE